MFMTRPGTFCLKRGGHSPEDVQSVEASLVSLEFEDFKIQIFLPVRI
jgi:hypothetical protein